MRHHLLGTILLALLGSGFLMHPLGAQSRDEEARDRQSAERARAALERNSRRGTALDRLYGYHLERGTLDDLLQQYQKRTAQNSADGAAWMILGLLEAQRRREDAAAAAFRQD